MSKPIEIPDQYCEWIADWLNDNILSDPSDQELHTIKTVTARAIAIAAYRYLAPERTRVINYADDLEKEVKRLEGFEALYLETFMSNVLLTGEVKEYREALKEDFVSVIQELEYEGYPNIAVDIRNILHKYTPKDKESDKEPR